MPIYTEEVVIRNDGLTYIQDSHRIYCDFCHKFVDRYHTQRYESHRQNITLCESCAQTYHSLILSCEHCHNFFIRDNTSHIIDGRVICRDCFSSYGTCEGCHTFVHLRYRHEEAVFCSRVCIANAGYTVCDRCDNIVHLDDYDNDHSACSDCVSYHTRECYRCGDSFYDYDGYNSDYCSEACYERQHAIHNYGYKPHPVFYSIPLENETKRFYGVELEIDNGDSREFLNGYDSSDTRTYLKEDGSLNEGIEIVSHPMSLKYHQEKMNWKELSTIAKRAGFKSHNTSTCGLHVHISKNSVSTKRWCKFVLFWYSHDDLIKQICRRGNTHYCEKKDVYPEDSPRTMTSSYTRYEAVNFQNRSTVEVRQFRGTLNPTSILASIEFLDFLLTWVYRVPIKKIASLTIAEFKEALSKKASVYPNLNSYITRQLED